MLYFLLFRDSWQFVTAISHYFELFDRKHWLNILKLSQSLKYTFSSSELFSSSRRCFKIAENAQFISKILWFTCALSMFFLFISFVLFLHILYIWRGKGILVSELKQSLPATILCLSCNVIAMAKNAKVIAW